jgi:hypothetical protein
MKSISNHTCPILHRVLFPLVPLLMAGIASAEPAPNIPGETIGQMAERTGYPVEMIREYFPVLTSEAMPGFAAERFPEPPPPGVHPRVFFGPGQLPWIREHAPEIQPLAHPAYDKLLAAHDGILDGSVEPQIWYEREFLPLVGNPGWIGDYLPIRMEALRCLLQEDEAGGRRLARASVVMARILQTRMEQFHAQRDMRLAKDIKRGFQNLGVVYDLNHGYMDKAQRDVLRSTLVEIYRGKWTQGSDSPPGPQANRSNWISHMFFEVCNLLAIEGEEGWDEIEPVYRGWLEAARKYVHFGFRPGGVPWEGLGKNQLSPHFLAPLANRGEPIIASDPAYNHIAKALLYLTVPWGEHAFPEWGIWGGSRHKVDLEDVHVIKYAFPEDPRVDYMYRLLFPEGPGKGFWETLYPVRLDENVSLAQARERITGEPLTAFFNYRGLMVTKSSWASDALQLWLQGVPNTGGHLPIPSPAFAFAGLGRYWAEVPVQAWGDNVRPGYNNVVTVDGDGASRAPAKVLNVVDHDWATFGVVDATYAYQWQWAADLNEPGAVPVDESPADFMLQEPTDHPSWKLPWRELPNWYSGLRPGHGDAPVADGYNTFGARKPHLPVAHAFRTVGLVRGAHPYALVVDDLQTSDDQAHRFQWTLQLPDDLSLQQIWSGRKGAQLNIPTHIFGSGQSEVLLVEADVAPVAHQRGAQKNVDFRDKDRKLLVRVLRAKNDQPGVADLRVEDYMKYNRWQAPGKRLVVESISQEPGFIVMLFPHRHGDELPRSTWSHNGTRLTISWAGQEDVYQVSRGDDGRTRLTLSRAGQEALQVD